MNNAMRDKVKTEKKKMKKGYVFTDENGKKLKVEIVHDLEDGAIAVYSVMEGEKK